jgi:hypothetical protein
MTRTLLAASISLLALAAGSAAMAQNASPGASPGAPLSIGGTVSAALDASDPTAGDGEGAYRYDDYSFTARAGQRLEAVLRAEDFDAYLEVFAPGAADEAFASDDDGMGEGTNSRLLFTAPEAGTYRLRARSLSGTDGGAYSLGLSQRPPAPRAPRPQGIRVGAVASGELTARDPESDDAIRYDAYALRLRSGQRIQIRLESDAFDPLVRIGRMSRGAFEELEQNDDDTTGGLNSRLVFTAPADGDYVIRATGLNATAEGRYTLKVEEGPAALTGKPITIGDEVSGELSNDDGLNDDSERADVYAFAATAGQRVEITLNASDFDAYLELFGPNGESLGEDDDGGDEGTNSRLVRTLAEAGTYTVQARALSEDGRGSYTLKIIEAAPVPEPTAIGFGQTVQGEIKADGARDDEGRSYVAYRFRGEEGSRIQAIVRSGDFDAFVQLGKADGNWEVLASDDDGLGEGTDSRLTFKLPTSGEYELRASPLGGGETGLFSVELLDKGPQPLPGSILIGASARGTLTENDAVTDEGVFYDAYRITVAAGDKLNVTLVSNDFDALLEIGRPKSDGEFESVATDDDSLSDTHAKIEWTVDRAGEYEIRARAFTGGQTTATQTGAYTVTVERKP